MIGSGAFVRHRPTGAHRRVVGVRGDVLHFSQVIKCAGETFYWADVNECDPLPIDLFPKPKESPTPMSHPSTADQADAFLRSARETIREFSPPDTERATAGLHGIASATFEFNRGCGLSAIRSTDPAARGNGVTLAMCYREDALFNLESALIRSRLRLLPEFEGEDEMLAAARAIAEAARLVVSMSVTE